MAKKIQSNSAGFSLLEIVIAIGVLMILSSVGVITVRGFDDKAKEAATQRAAREVYNAARAKAEDGRANTKPEDAVTEYNNSQTKKTINGNKPITVKFIKQGSNINDFHIQAYYDGGRIMSSYGDDKGSSGTGSGGSGTPVIPTIRDTVSQLTYQCDTTTTGYLPVYNVSDSTTVSLLGSDGSEKFVKYTVPNLTQVESSYESINFTKYTGFNNISEKVTMNAGVTYTVKVYGKFTNLSAINTYTSDDTHGTNLSFRDCLLSVDKLGKDSGLIAFNWIGGANFKNIPKEIPSTIVDLNCAFASATTFNDPNVSNWNTENVKELYYTFLYNNAFNQPLNWDTGNVWNFSGTFHNAKAFNNGGKPMRWDTSSATNMSSLFNGATAFNQNVSEFTDTATGMTYWDTSNVRTMASAFRGATNFNNGSTPKASGGSLLWRTNNVTDISFMFNNAVGFNTVIQRTNVHWNTSNVENMASLFEGATSYNKTIINWFTDSATDMSKMFKNATSYNKAIVSINRYWNTANVTNMTEMFFGATAFNQNLSSWKVDKVSSANRVNFNTNSAMANTPTYQPNWV